MSGRHARRPDEPRAKHLRADAAPDGIELELVASDGELLGRRGRHFAAGGTSVAEPAPLVISVSAARHFRADRAADHGTPTPRLVSPGPADVAPRGTHVRTTGGPLGATSHDTAVSGEGMAR